MAQRSPWSFPTGRAEIHVTTRVLLVDDHEIVRDGLHALIDRERPEFAVVGESGDGNSAVAASRDVAPDVVVMDVSMPGLNGIDATRMIVSEMPEVRVLCLSMHSDHSMVAATLEAGAAGYLVKDCAGTELVDAIREVSSLRIYLSPSVTEGVVRDYLAYIDAARHADQLRLSGREREVLQLIAEGHSTRAIATKLFISPKTVGTHSEHIKAKLGISSIAELTKYSIRHGLTTL